MSYTNYTAAQAVSRANSTTKFMTGRCLEFVMTCVNGERTGLFDANAAWAAAEQKEYTGVPPAGAPVYFRGGEHGHIALSVGGGKIRSTDYRTGYGYSAGPKGTYTPVGTATINEVALEFFGTTSAYRGWSRDYDGLIIRGLEETSTNYSPPPVVPEEDDMPTAADLWNYKIVSPNDPNYSTTAYSWLRSSAVNASEAKKLASQALAKVNALGTRQSIIEDVRDAVLNAPVPNHDPNPDDNVPPTVSAFRSYSVMSNWRAAQLQSDVAALTKSVAALTAKVDKLLNS